MKTSLISACFESFTELLLLVELCSKPVASAAFLLLNSRVSLYNALQSGG